MIWLGPCYYGPQLWPLRTASQLAESSLDRLIPFIPQTAWIYQSIFLLLPISFFIQPERKSLKFSFGFCLLTFLCAGIFWVFPTEFPPPTSVTHDNWAYNHLIVSIDGRLNSFPSLHAALTIFAGLSILTIPGINRSIQWVLTLWIFALLCSTLTTKQHIIADFVGGVLAGTIIFKFATYPRGYRQKGIRTPHLTKANARTCNSQS
jgi:membrane-associated phospholipid phosphatase